MYRSVTVSTNGPFDLSETLHCGQVFHWQPIQRQGVEGFAACVGNASPSFVAQTGDEDVLIVSADPGAVSRYLGLDHDLESIRSSFPTGDEFLERSIRFSPGIRLIRQPVWECLATFITSSLKQLVHIRAISLTLRERYGERFEWEKQIFHAYPEPEAIAQAGEAALRECALGYRAKSLHLAGQSIASGEVDLNRVEREADLAVAREELMRLHGVGEKIANCVLLFGCGRWGAFPIDVWIERVLRNEYRKRVKGEKLRLWAMEYFGPNAGYAQQYLFHFARKNGLLGARNSR